MKITPLKRMMLGALALNTEYLLPPTIILVEWVYIVHQGSGLFHGVLRIFSDLATTILRPVLQNHFE